MQRTAHVPRRPRRKRVIVAHGNAFVRRGLRSLLSTSSTIAVVGEADDAQALVRVLAGANPRKANVVLVDRELLESGGAALAGQLDSASPPILIFEASVGGHEDLGIRLVVGTSVGPLLSLGDLVHALRSAATRSAPVV